MRSVTAICLRYERRPTDVSEVSHTSMWKGDTKGAERLARDTMLHADVVHFVHFWEKFRAIPNPDAFCEFLSPQTYALWTTRGVVPCATKAVFSHGSGIG